jgi:2-oxoglutarate dehydrogenase E1 component
MDKYSFTNNAHPQYIESLYKDYLEDPESIDISWRKFFSGYEFALSQDGKQEAIPEHIQEEFKVLNLIHGYRTRGHLFTLTNPVRTRRKYSPTLDLKNFGLGDNDPNTVFQAGSEIGIGPATLQQIIEHLQQTYCQSVGVEYTHIYN